MAEVLFLRGEYDGRVINIRNPEQTLLQSLPLNHKKEHWLAAPEIENMPEYIDYKLIRFHNFTTQIYIGFPVDDDPEEILPTLIEYYKGRKR